MDKGSHYFRCDFQVHSPRDINWNGPRPISEEERKTYADSFIKACREKGLHAVAITDHHDIAFFRFIKYASENELAESGIPIQENERIIVFPGMELTLGVPCQALLVLDSNFPQDLLTSLNTILSAPSNDPSEPTHLSVGRLEHFKTIKDLCDHLDRTDYLRGRYIILPNVSDGGSSTLLRSGFAGIYKAMPCVGGYVDGSVEDLGDGNTAIVEGRNRDYGFKAIGVLQTSDNRHGDYRNLGVHTTWVKWSVPTAEALRQACLARKTRLLNTEPRIPSLILSSIEVSNSQFMGPINLEFNPQLNCLIGGRGTGKSTILEYLRWAMCDQPPTTADNGEVPDFQIKRSTLIQNTLIPLGAVVTVTFLLNSVPHIVRRNSRTNQLLLKIDKNEFTECNEEDIRRLLTIQAYSQKQLSGVSVRQEELQRFIRTPIERELSDIHIREEELKTRLRSLYLKINTKRKIAKQVERELREFDSLASQVKTLRGDLKGLSKEDQVTISGHELLLEEERIVKSYKNSLGELREIINTAYREICMLQGPIEYDKEFPNRDVSLKIQEDYLRILSESKRKLEELKVYLDERSDAVLVYNANIKEWDEKYEKQVEEYEAAKARASSHEDQLKEISNTEQRMRAINDSIAGNKKQLITLGSPEEEYGKTRSDWTNIYFKRYELLAAKCSELTNLSGNSIRATLKRGVGLKDIQERLERVIKGTSIRNKKVQDLCDSISQSSDPIQGWNRVLGELETLAVIENPEGVEIELPTTPVLIRVGFSSSDLQKICVKINVEEWLELSLLELKDIPIFEYQQREGEYIKFSDASAGQQSTALLRVLLKQDGPPLIIDQVEEDLDNQVILEIIEDIWVAKAKRQVIFSSHNANIVVNGDADLVAVCDYRTSGDQSGGLIKYQGAIDMDDIRNQITKIMEGGKEAFNLRKQKYGF